MAPTPKALRSSSLGSEAQAMKAATSLACCEMVDLVSSSKLTLSGVSWGGMAMKPPLGA